MPRRQATCPRSSSLLWQQAKPRPVSGHREATYQFGRALPYADLLAEDERIDLLLRRAKESQVSDDHDGAIEAWGAALPLLREADRELGVVDALLGLDESYYTLGDNSHGTEFIDAAFAVLASAGPSRQKAYTLARRGSHYWRASETAQAIPYFEAALAMAREVGADDVVARSLCSIGTAQAELGSHEEGMANVRESLRLAQAIGDEDQIARIYQNVAWVAGFGFELAESTPSSRRPSGSPSTVISTDT